MSEARIVRITGAIVEVRPLGGSALNELVRVGERALLGEVIRIRGDTATVQVYEETSGLTLGEPVCATGQPLTVELGPGLLGLVLDGVGRPLARLADSAGDFLSLGTAAPTLNPERRWTFEPLVGRGAPVSGGDVLGLVEESPGIEHRILTPPGVDSTVATIARGTYTVRDSFGALTDGTPLRLAQRWPLRVPRPVAKRLGASQPFVTGQRVLDFLFPVSQGGSVAVPGGFGTGKTIIEQSLAKFAEADVVVYVGCGERGNEMAEVLHAFPKLEDRAAGRSVMERTVLVVNTSNMPVAAREASVYLGVTIAEYYRDMGYRTAVMADSLSRWAEALREIAARLQEMPGEEGYPTYLGNRLAKLYERAGRVQACGSPERTGALTVIAAISPPGGDFSEPVTQASLRVVGALWALDAELAHQRQFPAVDWETSYTLYADRTAEWFAESGGSDWAELRRHTFELLQRDQELREIAGLVGQGALQDRDRLLLEIARVVREAVLGQSAYDPDDATSPISKTYCLASLVHRLYRAGLSALDAGVPIEELDLPRFRADLAALRHLSAAAMKDAAKRVERTIDALTSRADAPVPDGAP